jgi:hypothetical protein
MMGWTFLFLFIGLGAFIGILAMAAISNLPSDRK